MRAAARTKAASRSRCSGGVLEPLRVAEQSHPAAHGGHHRAYVARAWLCGRRRRARRRRRRTRCRRTARRTGPSRRARRRLVGRRGESRAVHWRSRNASCSAAIASSAGAPAAERAEVGRAVVLDLADHRQPRERLDGELEPQRALGEARPAVVARLVLGDQPQLADLGLERRGADDRGDRRGQADHLGHPACGSPRR